MATSHINPSRDSKVVGYLSLAVFAVAVALISGQTAPAAVAAGSLGLLVVGLRSARPLAVDAKVVVPARRLIEGDPVEVTITVAHPPGFDLDMMLVSPHNPLGDPRYEKRPLPGGGTEFTVTRSTEQWGHHQIGQVVMRATESASMLVWERNLGSCGSVRVLPTPSRLNEILDPRASQSTSGSHPARVIAGDGVEFVDIREYLPGDRVRDINWKVTARRGEPHINRRRPDRGGDVVVLLDALPDAGWEISAFGQSILHQAGEATWALIKNHLAAQDRVGVIVNRTRGVRYLPPGGGSRAQFALLDVLLDANATHVDEPLTSFSLAQIPPGALVVNVTSLANDQALRTAAALGANGRAAGVLAIGPGHLLDEYANLDASTSRLSRLTFDARVAYLRRVGISVAVWEPGHDLGRAVSRLGQMTRRRTRRGAA